VRATPDEARGAPLPGSLALAGLQAHLLIRNLQQKEEQRKGRQNSKRIAG
jgi:hypothetical protein